MAVTFYYNFHAPQDDKHSWRHTIWEQNKIHHTPFAMNAFIASFYWYGSIFLQNLNVQALTSIIRLFLFILQIGYVLHLFSDEAEHVNAAASVGSHFIVNNLFQFAFIMLFVRSHFIWAEIMLIINFFNLSSLYFRHNTTPRFVHMPATSGPLAWTFVALYWNGAIAVGAHNLAARIVANVAIWGILVYGLFFLAVYKVRLNGSEQQALARSVVRSL